MKGTSKMFDIFESLIAVLNRFDQEFEKMSRFITDGTPAIVGKHDGFVASIKRKNALPDIMHYHCIIHK